MQYHEPVMIKEVLSEIDPQPKEIVVDCTLGNAGHAIEFLKRTAPNGELIGFELDTKAIGEAKERLQKLSNSGEEDTLSRIKIINDNFRFIKKYVKRADCILADLGLRSGQLEEGGFSFQKDEPLDMRFGEQGTRAEEIINTYTKNELSDIFRDYGEEKNASLIAEAIVSARKKDKIKTTGQLTEIILEFYRQKLKSKKEVPWVGKSHPATRVFQALRIEANDELGALKQLLEDGVDILSPGGRIGIISYHSLEDRIVKRFYKTSPHLVVKTKKPIVPSEEEVQKNRRSRSAKLRVAVKKSQ